MFSIPFTFFSQLLFVFLVRLDGVKVTSAFCVSKNMSAKLAECKSMTEKLKCDRHKYYPMKELSITGRNCIPWNTVFIADGDIQNHLSKKLKNSSYCVTTHNDSIPWCYISMNPLIKEDCFDLCPADWSKNLCLVRHGKKECMTALRECPKTGIGHKNHTSRGMPCIHWRYVRKRKWYKELGYKNHSTNESFKQCHSVGWAPGGPWCYYGEHEDHWDNCYEVCPEISCRMIKFQLWPSLGFQHVKTIRSYKTSGYRPPPGTRAIVQCNATMKGEKSSFSKTIECTYTGHWTTPLETVCTKDVLDSDKRGVADFGIPSRGGDEDTSKGLRIPAFFMGCIAFTCLGVIILVTYFVVHRYQNRTAQQDKTETRTKAIDGNQTVYTETNGVNKAEGPNKTEKYIPW